MRYKYIDKMKEILDFAEKLYMLENRSPSTTEIANGVNFARGSVYRYLVEIRYREMIEYKDGEIGLH